MIQGHTHIATQKIVSYSRIRIKRSIKLVFVVVIVKRAIPSDKNQVLKQRHPKSNIRKGIQLQKVTFYIYWNKA